MKTHSARSLALSLLVLGCTDPVVLIVHGEAGVPDAPPPTRDHCEIDDAEGYVELGSPLDAVGLLPPLAQPIAVGRGALEGVTAVASLDRVYVDASGSFQPLPALGLPSGIRITALGFHEGTWWLGTHGGAGPTVFRFDAALGRWEDRGRPIDREGVVQLFSLGTALVVHTGRDLFLLDDPSTTAYRGLPRSEDEVVSDVVVTARGLYASLRGPSTRVLFSSDGTTFVDVPSDRSFVGPDLAAGRGAVIVSGGLSGGAGYARLDEADPTPTFRFVAGTFDSLVPAWIGDDGTVLWRTGSRFTFGTSIDGPLVGGGSDAVSNTSTGVALVWFIASDARSMVIPTAVSGGTLVVRSSDHGRTFAPAARENAPALSLELSSDGTTPVLRVRGDRGEWRLFALREGDVWEEITGALPHPSFAGVSGVEGALLSRTTEYGDTLPHVSYDGGRTWAALDFYFPSYSTNAGSALRVTSDFARDAEGRFLAATVGGTTAICCTGSKTGWGYLPGAGIWRYTDRWTPLNAGIPIEAPPDGGGGPPFRSDIDSISASEAGVFAVLRGRGVYRLVGDRWEEAGVGLPLDATLRLFSVRDEAGVPHAGAFDAEGMYVQAPSDVWLAVELDGTLTAVATRTDLLVRAGSAGLFASNDAGATWSPLPPLEGTDLGVRLLSLTRDRLYVVGEDHRVRALRVHCTEAE
jgi:hypothetical protein